jgi:hypothetical protein
MEKKRSVSYASEASHSSTVNRRVAGSAVFNESGGGGSVTCDALTVKDWLFIEATIRRSQRSGLVAIEYEADGCAGVVLTENGREAARLAPVQDGRWRLIEGARETATGALGDLLLGLLPPVTRSS